MTDDGILLRFEIAPDRFPEVENVVQALTAWADVLRATADIVVPGVPVRIEVAGVEEGSQIFSFFLRNAELFLSDLKGGSGEYPELTKVLISLGSLIAATAVGVGITEALTPESKLPDEQMQVFEDIRDNLTASAELQQSQKRFYCVLQNEPAYARVEVLGKGREVIHSVPRSEFAARSGLWSPDTVVLEAAKQKHTEVWDVVVIKPVLVPEERMWRFTKDGFELSALMQDKAVLQAIHDKTLPLQIAEGIIMKVEIEYRETYDGAVWLRDSRSYKIKRVISPALTPSPKPFFAPNIP